PTWNKQYKAVDFGGTDAAYGGQVDLLQKISNSRRCSEPVLQLTRNFPGV
ncbi:unnamed protein product, partial [marine sediment metagenome]